MKPSTAEAAALLERVERFARDEVAPTAAARDREARFDRDLWRGLADTGLLRALLPEAQGGLGLGFTALSSALRVLAEIGGDLSLCVSLAPALSIMNLVIARRGNEAQKARFLPPLISGEWVPAVAFSELPHGANPKHLAMSAERHGDTWTIDGLKAFVTNGTEADLYLVMAITEEKEGRKGFSAFLVERSTPGVAVEERMALDFVRAAPHGIIRFKEVRTPEENRIGPLHGALAISRKLREGEDAIGASTMAGHMARTVDLAASHAAGTLGDHLDRAEALGAMRVLAEQATAQADRVAALWPTRMGSVEQRGSREDERFLATLLAGRETARIFHERLGALLQDLPPKPDSDLERAVRDLSLSRIGGGAVKRELVRLGQRLAARA